MLKPQIKLLCQSLLSLVFLLISPLTQAEIFKWVDENGKVHFSDRQSLVAKADAEKLALDTSVNLMKSQPVSITREPESELEFEYSQDKASLNRQLPFDSQDVDHRCALARDIINGDAVLANGLATGKHEIEVAMRDIRKFCH